MNDDISFTTGKKLGSGGNGRVYKVITNEGINPYGKPLVVKVFFCKQEDSAIIDRRYERFSREVRTQKSLVADGIEGIIPIFTYLLPDKAGSQLPRNAAWSVMPEAKPFSLKKDESLLDKIKTMRDVALTLEAIHKRNIAHRDIKWKNLLYYDGRLCLSDFGLVWDGEDSDLTVEGETIGPHSILPKELLHIKKNDDHNYLYSDVYLFAKTFWQYLMCEEEVFDNEYRRSDGRFSLNTELDEEVSLDALHEMLEGATKEEWNDRISISECIELMDRQIFEIMTASHGVDKIAEPRMIHGKDKADGIYTIFDNDEIGKYLLGIAQGALISIFSEGQGGIRIKCDYMEIRDGEFIIHDIGGYHQIKARARMINKYDKRMFIECEPCTRDDGFVSIANIDLRDFDKICKIEIDVIAQMEVWQ